MKRIYTIEKSDYTINYDLGSRKGDCLCVHYFKNGKLVKITEYDPESEAGKDEIPKTKAMLKNL